MSFIINNEIANFVAKASGQRMVVVNEKNGELLGRCGSPEKGRVGLLSELKESQIKLHNKYQTCVDQEATPFDLAEVLVFARWLGYSGIDGCWKDYRFTGHADPSKKEWLAGMLIQQAQFGHAMIAIGQDDQWGEKIKAGHA